MVSHTALWVTRLEVARKKWGGGAAMKGKESPEKQNPWKV